MTSIERECRFEWIEAAIRWHLAQAKLHWAAHRRFCDIHSELCRPSGSQSSARFWTAEGPASDTPGRFLPDLAGASAPVIFDFVSGAVWNRALTADEPPSLQASLSRTKWRVD